MGRVAARADAVRLKGHDGGIVEFASDDVQIDDHLISVRLDAAARLIEPRSTARTSRSNRPAPWTDRESDCNGDDTTTIGLVVFSCHPFQPIGICFDLA